MQRYKNTGPAIRQGWLRVILFIVFYVLAVYAVSTIIPPESLPKNGSFALMALVSIVLVWAFRTLIDRQTFISLGMVLRGHEKSAAAGLLLGIILLSAGTVFLYVNGNLQWTDVLFDGNDLFIGLGLMLIVAFYEELVFRGYILNNLMESTGKYVALLISALLFALAHAGNPGASLLPIINIFLAGILLGLNYIHSKNIWLAIFFHFSWNFFQGPVLGYQVSGIGLQSILQQTLTGDEIFTGANFGFEGSIIATLLYAIAVAAIGYFYHRHSYPVLTSQQKVEQPFKA